MEKLELRYDAFAEAVGRERLRMLLDPAAAPRLREVDDAFADVTSGEVLDGLRRDAQQGTERARRRAHRLQHAIESAVIGARARAEELALRAARRDGAPTARRAELREQLWLSRASARAALGYPDERARLRARRPELDLERWRDAGEQLLARTAHRFAAVRASALARVGAPASASGRAALEAVLADARQSEWLPAGRLRAALGFALGPLAPELERLRWATAPTGRSQWLPIAIPAQVALIAGPAGGLGGAAELFEAGGAALAAALTSEALGVELRRPWDPALAHAWGALLRRRLGAADWLESLALGPADPEALCAAREFSELYALRAGAGRLPGAWALAERPAHRDPRALAGRYAQDMRAATGFEHGPEGYLDGIADAELRPLDRLRGACLAAQLELRLRRRCGRQYWRESRSWDELREIWDAGSSHTAEELAGALDLGPLALDALVESWELR